MSFAKVMIYGHIGSPPELRYTPSGDAVCNFSVAVNSKYGQEDRTTWFRITAWRKTAELIAQYFAKGDAIMLEGTIAEEKWTDRDGVERTTLAVNASAFHFTGTTSGQQDGAFPPTRREDQGRFSNRKPPGDDIPHSGPDQDPPRQPYRPGIDDEEIPF